MWSCLVLEIGEPQVNAGGCSLLSEVITVVIRNHFLYRILILTCTVILDSHFSMNTWRKSVKVRLKESHILVVYWRNAFCIWHFLFVRTLKWLNSDGLYEEYKVLKPRVLSLGDGLPVLYPQVSLIISRNFCLAQLLFSTQCALHPWSYVESWEYGFPLWPCAMKPPQT
jgi:hypothetical protein